VVFFWDKPKRKPLALSFINPPLSAEFKGKIMEIHLDKNLYTTLEEALPHFSTATEINARYCETLTNIKAPLATRVSVIECDALTAIEAPVATEIHVLYCHALTAIEAPLATRVALQYCDALTAIEAPLATSVSVHECNALASIVAPLANSVSVFGSDTLASIGAPVATSISVIECHSLTSIEAPLMTSVEVRGCTALTKFNSYRQLSDAQCKANLKIVAEIALASPDALFMDEVHVCDTTHCIAGTATHFLEGGIDMEAKLGWHLAGRFLLGKDAASHFGDNQEDGRKYLQGVLAEV
jgi:hypothetical protein